MRSQASTRLVATGWLAGAAMVVVALLLPRDDAALRHTAGTTFGVIALAALLAAAVAAQRASYAPSRHPRLLTVGQGRLDAATGVSLAYVTAVQPILFALLVIADLPRVREPAPAGISPLWIFFVAIILPIAFCVYLTVPFALRELAGEPGLSIGAAGVRMRVKVNQWRHIPWAAMDSQYPVILRGSILTVRAERPEQVHSGGLLLGRRRRYTTIQVRHRLAVDPEFVAAAIDYYARHPDERPGIGTASGYAKLVANLPETV